MTDILTVDEILVSQEGFPGPPGPGTEEFNEAVALANEALAMRGSPPPPPDRFTLALIAQAMDAQGVSFSAEAGRTGLPVDTTGAIPMSASIQAVMDALPLVPYRLPRKLIIDPGIYLLDTPLRCRNDVVPHARFRRSVFLRRDRSNHEYMYGAPDEAAGTLSNVGLTGGIVFEGNRLDIDIISLRIDPASDGKTALAEVSVEDMAKLIDQQDYAITQKYRSDRSHWFFANPDDENWATSPTSNTRRTITFRDATHFSYRLDRAPNTNYPTGTANPALSFVVSDDFHCVRLPGDGNSTGLNLDIEVWDYSRGSSAVSTPGWKSPRGLRVIGGRGGSPYIHMWYAIGCQDATDVEFEGEDCDGAVIKWSGSSLGSRGFKGRGVVKRSYRGAAFPDYSHVDVELFGEDCMRALQFTSEQSWFENNRARVHLRRCGYLPLEYGAVEISGKGILCHVVGAWNSCPVAARVKTVSQAYVEGIVGGTDIPLYRELSDGSFEEPQGDGTYVTFTLRRSSGQPEYVGLYNGMPAFISRMSNPLANGWVILEKINAYTWRYKREGVYGPQGHDARMAEMDSYEYVIASDVGSTRATLNLTMRAVGNGAPLRSPGRVYETSDDAVCWGPTSELYPKLPSPAGDPSGWTNGFRTDVRIENYGVDKINVPVVPFTEAPNREGQVVLLENPSGGQALAVSVAAVWNPITAEVNHGAATLATAQGDLPAGTLGYVVTPGNANSWHVDSGAYQGHHYVVLNPAGAGTSTDCFFRRTGADGYQTRVGFIDGSGKFQILARLTGTMQCWIDFTGTVLRKRALGYIWNVLGDGRTRVRVSPTSQITLYPNESARTQIIDGNLAAELPIILQTIGATPETGWRIVRRATGSPIRIYWRPPGNAVVDLLRLYNPGEEVEIAWVAGTDDLVYRIIGTGGDWSTLLGRVAALESA